VVASWDYHRGAKSRVSVRENPVRFMVGPAHVCSAGGKWYVLAIVDDYSHYAWVFFLADKGETFGFVRDLILRLNNERHGDVVRAICSDNGSEFKNSHFETFCRDLGLEHQFSSP
jgi:transposase InsO family protein